MREEDLLDKHGKTLSELGFTTYAWKGCKIVTREDGCCFIHGGLSAQDYSYMNMIAELYIKVQSLTKEVKELKKEAIMLRGDSK